MFIFTLYKYDINNYTFTMKKIQKAIESNIYIKNTESTIFTVLLDKVLHENPDIELDKEYYVHALLGYPKWCKNSDIFCYIKDKPLSLLQKNKAYFVFDASTEGFSTLYDQPFFDVLYFNCEKYGVDTSQIIFVSSNLRDEKNMKIFSVRNNKKPLNVFSFISFEQVLAIDDGQALERCEEFFETSYKQCKSQFNDKYFSSLSRVNREWRMYSQAILFNSGLQKRALLSHDKIEENFTQFLHDKKLSREKINNFKKSLPLTVDQKDFSKNWAINTPYTNIHDQTLFQLVNETLVEDLNESTLFYSEKTFRPIAKFQPFVIWGQPGANTQLKNIGYCFYEDWFDLIFDNENDHVRRHKMLFEMLQHVCAEIDQLSKDEKIEWRFKNTEVLKHNFKTMASSEWSKDKLKEFIKKI